MGGKVVNWLSRRGFLATRRKTRRCESWTWKKCDLSYSERKEELLVLSGGASGGDEVGGRAMHAVKFCHNDLLAGNILVKDGAGLEFIDFEYACINHVGFDI